MLLARTLAISLWIFTGAVPVDTPLAGKNLSPFRAPCGDWLMAGSVAADPADEKKLAWTPGTEIAVNGANGKTAHLVTKAEYGDVEVHFEFMVPKGSNSGLYFMGRYEIQILDSWGVTEPHSGDCGGIYQRWRNDPGLDESKRGYEGCPPRVNASKKPGEWQSFDVIFHAPRFDDAGKKTAPAEFLRVMHNGVVIHEGQKLSGPTRAAMYDDEKATGPLMVQGDHGPVAIRNVRITRLDGEKKL